MCSINSGCWCYNFFLVFVLVWSRVCIIYNNVSWAQRLCSIQLVEFQHQVQNLKLGPPLSLWAIRDCEARWPKKIPALAFYQIWEYLAPPHLLPPGSLSPPPAAAPPTRPRRCPLRLCLLSHPRSSCRSLLLCGALAAPCFSPSPSLFSALLFFLVLTLTW